MKNAMVIPVVLVITLLISMLIGTYMMSSSVHISKEFHRDLAEVRGYWGAYGAKELNRDITTYTYTNYNINISKNSNAYEWNLTIPNGKTSGIANNDLYVRIITVVNADENDTNIIKYGL